MNLTRNDLIYLHRFFFKWGKLKAARKILRALILNSYNLELILDNIFSWEINCYLESNGYKSKISSNGLINNYYIEKNIKQKEVL